MLNLRKQLYTIINYSQHDSVKYILAHYFIYEYTGEEAISITIVVKDTLISKSSILKFCRSLGYDSWKKFCTELRVSCEKEKIHLDSSKINTGILYNKKIDLEKHKHFFLKTWEEYHMLVGKEELLYCIHCIDNASQIIVLGNIMEFALFAGLQRVLSLYQKEIIFPKVTDIGAFHKQLESLDSNALLFYVDSTLKWDTIKEREMMKANYYMIDIILLSKAKIIHIGQAKTSGQREEVYEVALPFSFNNNFTRILLYEFITALEDAYIRMH